jgi:methionyl-tRNA synthetase
MDIRTVVSGISEFFEPEAIIGKQICILANLEPREIKGIKSQGMILLAEDSTGKLVFVTPDNGVNNGAEVK